ncbi:MAG: zinc ABC transporter substrate-binding protein [Anaerolineae bacterium]|nr:zinc ABC transporter substrate-binding protein [Anaerolineae bacterium]
MKRSTCSLLIIGILYLLTACGRTPPELTTFDGCLKVTVSIVPQKYFVERVGGEHVDVNVMVLPGNNPATYEPKPEQLMALDKSAAYFSIGVPFENSWLEKIAAANEDMPIVDTAAGIERMPMGEVHDQGEEEREHSVGSPDPHIWLSPELVKVQSQNIYAALAELDPAHEGEYKANLGAFIADIDKLETDIKETLEGVKSKKFIVFHPAWGYFARDFGLEMVSIEIGGQEPSAQELAHLVEMAREENIRVVFAQPEFSTQDAGTIAQEIGGEVILISPLAEDWLSNLQRVADTFAEALLR